jgi:hypothetical protein
MKLIGAERTRCSFATRSTEKQAVHIAKRLKLRYVEFTNIDETRS